MRPELDLIERIERYLSGDITPADKAAFETQLASDPDLREAVQLQQDIQVGLERASLTGAIREAKRRFYRRRWYRWGGFGAGLIIIVIFVTLLARPHKRDFLIVPGMPPTTHGQFYTIDCSRDTVLRTSDGALIRIPQGSMDAGGKSSVQLEIKEAYNIADMLRFGLLTQTDGRPLSSGGMIDIEPVPAGAARIVRAINVSLPTRRIEANMKRYKGVMEKDGKLNWTDPGPLADSSVYNPIASGRTLFENNCRACHAISTAITGPALAYIGQRRPDEWLYNFIRKSDTLLASGDCYANYVYNIYNKSAMTAFPNLTHADIHAMIEYITSESQLIDSNQVPNYTREFDSCRQYKRMAGELEKNRQALIAANGSRTQTIHHYDTGTISVNADSLPVDTTTVNTPTANKLYGYTPLPTVDIVDHPSMYYQFTIESFGWYNVDALLKELPGIVPSELRVQLSADMAAEVNVFLVLPGRKIFTEGGLLKASKTIFGFFAEDGRIPLPQREQAYVIAAGEYKGKPVFAIHPFMTALQQTIDLQPTAMTTEQIMGTIARLDPNQLSVRVTDSRNAARIRASDTALAAIARFKPQHCDCECMPAVPKADSALELRPESANLSGGRIR